MNLVYVVYLQVKRIVQQHLTFSLCRKLKLLIDIACLPAFPFFLFLSHFTLLVFLLSFLFECRPLRLQHMYDTFSSWLDWSVNRTTDQSLTVIIIGTKFLFTLTKLKTSMLNAQDILLCFQKSSWPNWRRHSWHVT